MSREPTPISSVSSPLIGRSLWTGYHALKAAASDQGSDSLGATLREWAELWSLSWPIMVGFLTWSLMSLVDISMVGHLGNDELAGVALASMWNAVGSWFAIGLLSAVETLVAQAYGAGQPRAIGLAVQRALIVATIFSIPVAITWWYTSPVLILMGQAPELAAFAARYNRLLIWSLIPYLYFQVTQKVLAAQEDVSPAMWAGITGNIINFVANRVLIWGVGPWSGLGFNGAPIATNISRFALLVITLTIARYKRLHSSWWSGWTLSKAMSPSGLYEFLRLGIPAGFQTAAEEFGWSGTTLIVGIAMSSVEVDVHVAALNIGLILYCIPWGLSTAICQHVGSALGDNNPRGARRSALAGLSLGALVQAAIGICLYFFRSSLGSLFSTDPRVVSGVAGIMPLVAAFQIGDAIQVCATGVFRGAGRNDLSMWITFLGFYGGCIPLAAYAAFIAESGLTGVWFGTFVGITIVAFVASCVILCGCGFSWTKAAVVAMERLQNSASSLPSTAANSASSSPVLVPTRLSSSSLFDNLPSRWEPEQHEPTRPHEQGSAADYHLL